MWWQYIFMCGRPAEVTRQGTIKRPGGSIRGQLVRSYNTNIEEDFYLDKEHELGKGGCGVVVVGENKQTRGQYAIKIINKATAERGRLDRELKLMKDVDHANIVRLFSVYDTPSNMYFVMELCLGGHLGNLLSRQPNKCVDEEWAKKLCRQLLSAVTHIHSRGIAHRDIKLQNILVDSTIDRNAQLKLIDFGYGSRFIGALPMKTKCGTPYTTAPEVIRESYDQRCDVWSCGVVIYIMLCGRRPFEALDVGGPLSDAGKAAMITNILAGRYHFNHKQWQNVSRQAVNFVKALLNPDYKHRMHSHEALDSPWLKDNQIIANQSKMLSSEKGARALSMLKQSTDNNEFQRAGMMALVFGIPSRAAADLRAVFQSFDTDSSGGLSRSEFQGALNRLAPELTTADIDRLFDIVDIDKNQQISYTEFLVATLDPRDVDIEELNKAFNLLDEDGNGFITRDEMRKVVKQMLQQQLENSNEKASDLLQLSSRPLSNSGDYLDDLVEQRIENIFAQADKDNDGTISQDEFIWAMTGMDPELFSANAPQQKKASTVQSRSRNNSGVASPTALGKMSSGYFHSSDRFSMRPDANSSVRGLNGLSFKGSHTMAVTEMDSQLGSMARVGSTLSTAPPRQSSLKGLQKPSFRATGKIVEESSAVTGSSGRMNSIRPLVSEPSESNADPSAAGANSRAVSKRGLSMTLPTADEHAVCERQTVAADNGVLAGGASSTTASNTATSSGTAVVSGKLHSPSRNSNSGNVSRSPSRRLTSSTAQRTTTADEEILDQPLSSALSSKGVSVDAVGLGSSSPLPQFKGVLARNSQKTVLVGDETAVGVHISPRLTAGVPVRETMRGHSGSLAMSALVSEELQIPDTGSSVDDNNAMASNRFSDDPSSSSSYNTQTVAQLFGPPGNNFSHQHPSSSSSTAAAGVNRRPQNASNSNQSSSGSIPYVVSADSRAGTAVLSTSVLPGSSAAAAVSGGNQQQSMSASSVLGSVKETKVYFTAHDETSHSGFSDMDHRRNSITSVSSKQHSTVLHQQNSSSHNNNNNIDNHRTQEVCVVGEPSSYDVLPVTTEHHSNSSSSSSTSNKHNNSNNNNNVAVHGTNKSSSKARTSQNTQRNASVSSTDALSSVQTLPASVSTTSVPIRFTDINDNMQAQGTPKLTKLGSKRASSFKRDVSNKYLVTDSYNNEDADFIDSHYEERVDAEPVPPSLSRLGSRGVSFSARSQRDLDSSSSQEVSVPLTSPSFLANIKRMMSSSNTADLVGMER